MVVHDLTDIQWYPGHMAKALRQLVEQISRADVVVEVVDARVPRSGRNHELKKLLGNKPCLTVFSHLDLVEQSTLSPWLEKFKANNEQVLAVSLNGSKARGQLLAALDLFHKPILERAQARGQKSRPLRLFVTGVPNSGKSTLINLLRGKRSVEVQNRPGVTRSLQWIRLGAELELLDTPGLLPPKIDTAEARFGLAVTGAIPDDILPLEAVAYALFDYLEDNFNAVLSARYKYSSDFDLDLYERYITCARKSGCVKSGGNADTERFARILLRDFRTGKFGAIILDKMKA